MKINIFVSLLVMFLSANAYAWKERGNGGGGFACLDRSGNILPGSVISQDVWEVSQEYNVIESNLDYEDLAKQRVLKRFKEHDLMGESFLEMVSESLEYIIKVREFVDYKLDPVNDDYRDNETIKCYQGVPAFVQVAIYSDEKDSLIINKILFEQMSNVSKAALLVHEAIYKTSRKLFNQSNSIYSRRHVGFLFSDMPPEKINLFIRFDGVIEMIDLDRDGIIKGCEVDHLVDYIMAELIKIYGDDVFKGKFGTGNPEQYIKFHKPFILFFLRYARYPSSAIQLYKFYLSNYRMPFSEDRRRLEMNNDVLKFSLESWGFIFL